MEWEYANLRDSHLQKPASIDAELRIVFPGPKMGINEIIYAFRLKIVDHRQSSSMSFVGLVPVDSHFLPASHLWGSNKTKSRLFSVIALRPRFNSTQWDLP